jgi:nicotinate-nucleotide adenylyltransferase
VRLGLFGGSFDPPHIGHLLTAGDALEALALDKLVFIPAAVQPLKVGRAAAAPEHRLAMVRYMADDDPRFDVDSIEIERPGLSFTVDTLAAYAARYPDAERFLIVGADILPTFHQWRSPERIAELATIAVLKRMDGTPDLRSIPGRTVLLPTRRLDISSTEIRERVRDGRTIRGFVPEAVAAYITAQRLYR